GSEPDHPGLLLVRAVTELALSSGSLEEYESNLTAAVRSSTERYRIGNDDLAALARWLAPRSARRPPSLPATYHAFASNGHVDLAGQVRRELPADVEVPGLEVLELVDRLQRITRSVGALAEELVMRSLR